MAQKAIHVNSAPTDAMNIRAEDDAAWLTALTNGTAGSVSGILPWGNHLTASKVSDNLVRLQPGLYSMQGFVLKVAAAEDFTIQNGVQGKNRIDLIVAEYRKGAERDTYALKVVMGTQTDGTAAAPSLTAQDIHFGGNVRQEEVARVTLSGTSISKVIITAQVLKGIGELMTLINNIVSGVTKVGDADKLDGLHSSAFATSEQGTKADAALPVSSYTAADVLAKLKGVDGSGSGVDADLLDGKDSTAFATAAQGTKADNALPASSYTASDVKAKLLTVDGSGSGLDADLLDGNHASAFAAASHTHTSVNITDLWPVKISTAAPSGTGDGTGQLWIQY